MLELPVRENKGWGEGVGLHNLRVIIMHIVILYTAVGITACVMEEATVFKVVRGTVQ